MPRGGETPRRARTVRTMTGDYRGIAGRIPVDQGPCSTKGIPERRSATLDMANADCLSPEEDGVIVGVTSSVLDRFTSFVSCVAVAPGAERQLEFRRLSPQFRLRPRR